MQSVDKWPVIKTVQSGRNWHMALHTIQKCHDDNNSVLILRWFPQNEVAVKIYFKKCNKKNRSASRKRLFPNKGGTRDEQEKWISTVIKRVFQNLPQQMKLNSTTVTE